MSTILNRNTDGTRTVPLEERELMQELTVGSEDYGKVKIGTDGTLEGEVLLAKDEDVAAKQAQLISGTNIKTVNGDSILGTGDITTVTVNDTLISTSTTEALSANQGRVLNDSIGTNSQAIADLAASDITYDNTTSGMAADNVQDAINEVISNTITDTPTLSSNASATETSTIYVTIDNYNALFTYDNLSVVAGTAVRDGAVIAWTVEQVTVDTDYDLSIRATEDGKTPTTATHTVTWKDYTGVADQVAIYENATMTATEYPTLVNVDISSNTLLATVDDATATSAKLSQNVEDGDFAKHTVTIDNSAKLYVIDGETVSTITPHTSATSASGTVAVSSEYDWSTPGWAAVDGSIAEGHGWTSASGDIGVDNTAWVRYLFNTSKVISTYSITGPANTYSSGKPKTWTFEGSNNGSDWDILDTQSVASWAYCQTREFTVSSPADYTYYRVNISAATDGTSSVALGEIKMYEHVTFATNTSAPVSGQTLVEGDILLVNDGASVDLIEFDSSGNVTDNGGGDYTLDLTSLSLTSVPTIIAKDTSPIATSLVATDGVDDFIVLVDDGKVADAARTPTKITTTFPDDFRVGRDFKHKVTLNDVGDEIPRVQVEFEKETI